MTDLDPIARAIYKEYYSDAPGKRSRTLVSIITAALQQARREALVEARGEIADLRYYRALRMIHQRKVFAILDRRIAACAADEVKTS